jgi:ribosomal-protein-alanine N-acetyltransferase
MLRIDGDRIYLRDHRPDDLSIFHSWISDPVIMQNLPWRTSTVEESFIQLAESIQESIREDRSYYDLAIILKQSGEIIGDAGFTIEVRESTGGIASMGFFFLKPYWGNGYATEVAQLLIEYCFTVLNLHKVTAGCDSENTASENVMKKCGMKQEAYRKQHFFIDGQWRDRLEYGIVYEEWAR